MAAPAQVPANGGSGGGNGKQPKPTGASAMREAARQASHEAGAHDDTASVTSIGEHVRTYLRDYFLGTFSFACWVVVWLC